ncbi:MAG: DEAD/DEAH box helicase, partial [Candidatus Diapherotrites archaeon]|nr:DEAD/DEAH box helicase [Candidatus Diapherotrites archaeon]
ESVLKGGNSLVVAPTALGKTIVAVLVAADRLEKEKEGKILFLAPTKPLCEQHQKTMQKLMELSDEKITLLTGSIASKKRAGQWENASIVIATPQTIENDARKKRISLENVSLVIFDEAHRAMGDYAYVYLAKKYMKQNSKGMILGLTASPGGEEKHIKDVCSNLFVKNIEIKALQDDDVKPYSHEIKFEWRMVELPEEFIEIKGHIEAFMKRQAETLQKFGIIKTASLKWLGKARLIQMQNSLRKRIAASRQKNPSIFAAVTAVAALMKASHAHTLLETQGVNALHSYLEREKAKKGKVTRATSMFLASMEMVQASEIAAGLNEKGVIHPKFQALKQELEKQFELRPESSAIVFNHYRDSIKRVTEELNKIPGIRAERFVGQAARGLEKGMTQKEQAEKIQELKEGKVNTLVCSSVGEEGLDIPSVDLVVFYEPVPSEIRFIQRRGRTGRLSAGRALILMAKNTRDEAYYWSSLRKEKKMHSILNRMKGNSKDMTTENPNTSAREKQTTLHSFSNSDNGKIVVYADSREQDSPVIGLLRELECEVALKQLEVGDYIPSKDIAIERKTVSDFLNSIVDGRLSQQLMGLAETYERPLVIVEGNREELFTSRNIHRNAIIGMLTSIALNYRVPLLFTDGARETAHYIHVIAKREQMGKGADLRLRIGRKGLSEQEQQRFIVESLPLVGPMTAKKLLQHFGSVKAIFNAGEKEMQEVEKMGKEKARKIKKVLEAEWE